MRISESDWNVFLGHAAATLAKLQEAAGRAQDRADVRVLRRAKGQVQPTKRSKRRLRRHGWALGVSLALPFGFWVVFLVHGISQKYNYFTLEQKIACAEGLAV